MIFLETKCNNPIDNAVEVVNVYRDRFGKVLEDSLVITVNDLINVTENMDVVQYIIECPDHFFRNATEALRETVGVDGFVRLADIGYEIPVWKVHDPRNVNKLVKISGLITRVTPRMSKPLIVFYRCPACANVKMAFHNEKNVKCDKCGAKMIAESSPQHTIKYRIYVIQDINNEKRETVELHLFGDNVDIVDVGDVVDVVGIVRERYTEMRKQLYIRYYVLGIFAKKRDVQYEHVDEKVINYIANNNPTEFVPRSIAPHIYGLDYVKKILALQMVSTGSDTTRRRDRIHVMLLGDPAVAKTQLLNAVVEIMPRAFYVVAHGSTSAGLGGAVVKDELTGEFMVEPGVLTLANDSIVAIDEFDKVREIPVLLESMERGTVTIVKAGKAQFNARAAILAAANPIGGRYKPNRTLFENFNIPLPLYSRFDIIYVLRDIVDEHQDREIARAIASGYSAVDNNYSIVRKFVLYARTLKPTPTVDAVDYAIDFYVKLRKQNGNITARQLWSLFRLARAHAKLRLSQSMDIDDMKVAISLFAKALESQGFTMEDFDAVMLESGIESKRSEYATEIYNYIKNRGDMVDIAEIYDSFKYVLTKNDIDVIVDQLTRAGKVYWPMRTKVKAIR